MATLTTENKNQLLQLAERIEQHQPYKMISEEAVTFIYKEDIKAIVEALRLYCSV